MIAAAVRGLVAEPGADPPAVVGHSMSGIALPLVPALAPVRALIFLGALIPTPGRTMASIQAAEAVLGDTSAVSRDPEGRSYWTSERSAIEILYPDCDPAAAGELAARLRPQAPAPHDQPCPLERFPDVPISSVVMSEDRMVLPPWSRRASRERLGVEPIEFPGGHSPMVSRPEALADLLIAQIAAPAGTF